MKKMKHIQNKGVSHEEDEALRKQFKGVANTMPFFGKGQREGASGGAQRCYQ